MDEAIHYCARHPQRDTGLRCNRCERYMCTDCAQRTPVGYTCRECLRRHEDKFYQGTWLDYARVAAVGAAGGACLAFGTLLLGGFLLLGILLAPALGGTTAQLALQMTGHRRGRQSGIVCAGALLLGGLAADLALTGGLGLLSLLILALASSAAYARFQLRI